MSQAHSSRKLGVVWVSIAPGAGRPSAVGSSHRPAAHPPRPRLGACTVPSHRPRGLTAPASARSDRLLCILSHRTRVRRVNGCPGAACMGVCSYLPRTQVVSPAPGLCPLCIPLPRGGHRDLQAAPAGGPSTAHSIQVTSAHPRSRFRLGAFLLSLRHLWKCPPPSLASSTTSSRPAPWTRPSCHLLCTVGPHGLSACLLDVWGPGGQD